MGRRCNLDGVHKAAKGNLTLSHEYAVDIARDLEDAERELAAAKEELAKWNLDGPVAKENRVAIDVLLEAASALAHLRPSTLDIVERPRIAAPIYTTRGLAMHVRTGKYLAIRMEVPGWVGREPKAGPLPKPPPCRCGLTSGHEPTCPELDP